MKQRCFNPNSSSYKRYGAKGVTICPRWVESFEAFLADMGERPKGETIDRVDGSKGYLCGRPECCGQVEPNCRWATRTDQARNRNCTKLNSGKVREMRERHAVGESCASIGRAYGVSHQVARQAVSGKTWADIA